MVFGSVLNWNHDSYCTFNFTYWSVFRFENAICIMYWFTLNVSVKNIVISKICKWSYFLWQQNSNWILFVMLLCRIIMVHGSVWEINSMHWEKCNVKVGCIFAKNDHFLFLLNSWTTDEIYYYYGGTFNLNVDLHLYYKYAVCFLICISERKLFSMHLPCYDYLWWNLCEDFFCAKFASCSFHMYDKIVNGNIKKWHVVFWWMSLN